MTQSVITHSDAGACLWVVESGADFGSTGPDDGVAEASARTTVVQQADETPAELALRCTRRAMRLIRTGSALEAGVIIASDAVNDEVFLCRCQIARSMIGAMRGALEPRLIFVAPSTISDEGRHELFSIAGTLATQLSGTAIEVSVRFAEHREPSGIHPVVKSLPELGAPPSAEVA